MTLPTLRTDVKFLRSIGKRGVCLYLVDDPNSHEVYALKDKEYFLCQQLDGKTSLKEIASRFEERFGLSLDAEQLEAFLQQIERMGMLADTARPSPSTLDLFQFQPPDTWKRWKLFNPEKILVWMADSFWWCYTKSFVTVSCILLVLAIGIVVFNYAAIAHEVKLLVKPLTVFQMLAIMYLCLNIPGELFRGMTSTRFGGQGVEYGIWLAYNVFPRFYCLSKMWKISERSKRSWFFFTPTYYAILTGSLGVLLWSMTTSSSVLHKFGLTLAVLCTVDSAFRLNFFWPSEAYYLLANWFGVQNLRQRAISAAKSWLLRRTLPEPLTSKEKTVFIIYGILTSLSTFPAIVVAGYIIGTNLIAVYAGIGGLLFAAVVTIKYRKAISGLLKENAMFQRMVNTSVIPKNRKGARTIFWVASAAVILLFPYPYEAGGPFTLLPLERIELHTVVPGEIKTVLVREGSIVKKGEVQATVDDREHKKNLEVAQAGLDKARQDLKLLEDGPKPEEIKKAQEQVATARTQAEYSRKEEKRLKALYKEGVVSQEEYQNAANRADVDEKALDVAKANLELVKSGARAEEIEAQKATVRDFEAKVVNYSEKLHQTALHAPMDGRVVTPYLEMKVGQFMKEGDLFAVYEASGEIQAEIQIPESDIGEVAIGNKVRIRPMAYPTKFFQGTVTLIAPQATVTPNGKVVRVLTRIQNDNQELKPEMTGEAKIRGGWKPVIVAFTRAIVRFVMVEMWSWLP